MSKSTHSERAVEEKVTVKTLIWVAILSMASTIFWDVWAAFLPAVAACTQSVSILITTPGIALMGFPFLALLLSMVLIRTPLMKKHLTTANLVYIYVIALAVAYFSSFYYPSEYLAQLLFVRMYSPEYVVRYFPDFVSPPKDAAELIWKGVGDIGAIPWIAVLPTAIWNFLIVALFGCINISLVNIFRRQWIDVEMIPFPHAMLAYVNIVNVESSVKPVWPSKIPFLIGILLGLLLEIPISATTLFPWFPDLYSWKSNTCGPGSHWIAPPDIPWNLGIIKNPPVYAMLLLVPLHFLFSIVFYTLVLEIALLIAYYGFGYYTGMLQIGFCGRNWCFPTPYTDPPLYFAVINTGCAIGYFVMALFLRRRYIVNTLRAAFRKSGTAEVEGEPISYRAAWTMLIVSFVAMMAFFMYTGISPWVSFATILSGVVMCFVSVGVWGLAGMDWDSPGRTVAPGLVRLLVYPTLSGSPEVTSTDLALAPVIPTRWGGMAPCGWGNSIYVATASYTVARYTNVNPRNVFKVMIVAMFTSMLVTNLAVLSIFGVFGASRFWRSPQLEVWRIEFWNRPSPHSMTEVAPWIVTGFLFMVVMSYLYSRILWLPNPLAAIPAWSWTVSLHGVWFACLVVWIIKSIVLKIGGSKLYEDWVVPFAGGFIAGTTLEIAITAIASFILFPPTL